MPRLTKEQKKAYIKGDGCFCPYCQSPNIEAQGQVDMDGPTGTQDVACNECNKEWKDVLGLVDIWEEEV